MEVEGEEGGIVVIFLYNSGGFYFYSKKYLKKCDIAARLAATSQFFRVEENGGYARDLFFLPKKFFLPAWFYNPATTTTPAAATAPPLLVATRR